MHAKLPCGQVRSFIGDIWDLEPQAIGFFYVNVVAPLNLEHPILQIKQVVNGTLMTVAPVGKFSGWFFSKELELAIDLGYDIEILKGYTYSQSEVLFKEYMDALYEMRTQFPKTNALNQIAKLLGNSFYGRFGMHPLFNPTKVLNKSDFYKLILAYATGDISLLKDFISLNDEFFITTNSANEDKVILGDSIIKTDVSIGIAAAVTAYSRIIMAQFKNLAAESGVNLYYTDTDSVVTNLGPEAMEKVFGVIIGNEIGQLKLEYEIEKAVFLAPKAYYLELENGDKIIKVKGLNQNNLTQENKDKLNLNNFVNLLKKDAAIDLEQEIWSKNREQGLVDIVQQAYQLKANQNKRELIYNDQGFFVDTKPFILHQVPGTSSAKKGY